MAASDGARVALSDVADAIVERARRALRARGAGALRGGGGAGGGAGEASEALPSRIDTTTMGQFLEVSQDKLTARYGGEAAHSNDVGAAQGDCCEPRRAALYYYELRVINAGRDGAIAIGFSQEGARLTRQPGWDPNSYGYHGDDGRKFHNNGTGEPYGPHFGAGDVVGAGINTADRTIFFTRNGVDLGVAFEGVRSNLRPSFGLHSKDEEVRVNFGQEPFMYDVDAAVRRSRERLAARVATFAANASTAHALVRSYLAHHGYARTLDAFVRSAGTSADGAATTSENGEGGGEKGRADAITNATLEARAQVRALLLEGDVRAASHRIASDFPAAMAQGSRARFYLDCQQLIELVRQGNADEAAAHAAANLCVDDAEADQQSNGMADGGTGASDEDGGTVRTPLANRLVYLAEVVALLAYDVSSIADHARASNGGGGGSVSAEEAALAPLLSQAQRERTADEVNECILHSELVSVAGCDAGSHVGGMPPHDRLRTAAQHLQVCRDELRERTGRFGEVYDVVREIRACVDGVDAAGRGADETLRCDEVEADARMDEADAP